MDNPQNILDASEYILMAFNNITNYNEFLEYKEELIEAITDIRNTMLNIIQKNKNKSRKSNDNNLNIDNNDKENNSNNSILSSMLGLKFNYDPYFNEKQLRNLTQDEEKIKNSINPNYTINNSINNEINKKNIGYKYSLRNKFITNNKIKPKINNNYFDQLYSIDNNNNDNNNNPKKKQSKKEKISLIADIIMKMNNEDYIFEILTKLFGDDLTDRLMSNNVNDDLLEALQNAIKEIELSKKNGKNEEIEDKPKKFPIDALKHRKFRNDIKRSQSSKKYNGGMKSNNIYKEFNFVKSLRKNQGGKISGKNKNSNNSKCIKKEKPFINATNPYGNYFDAPLQNGGYSKLNIYKNIID